MGIRKILFRVARLAGKGLFFFFLGIFLLEVLFDVNPTKIFVAGTNFSISFYVYITLYDLMHFFWAGLIALVAASVLFALSRYRYIPFALLIFGVAFYYEIIQSNALMQYYEVTYACHEVITSKGTFLAYVCPLMSMLNGHPDIPLQGSVLAPLALGISSISFLVWRLNSGVKSALAETVILGSLIVSFFEMLIYEYQRDWFTKQVTDYQKLVYLGNTTNQDLLTAGLTMLVIFAGIRALLFFLNRRRIARGDKLASPFVSAEAEGSFAPSVRFHVGSKGRESTSDRKE